MSKWQALAVSILLIGDCAFAQASDPPAMISGGVGSESREEMQAVSDQYPLHVVLATQSGSFLADVQVVIRSEDGAIAAQAVSEGPMLFVDLPPGSYTVEAIRSDGPSATAHVKVPASGPPVEVVVRVGLTDPSSGQRLR